MAETIDIRAARVKDLKALAAIERDVFPGDCLSPRSFRELIRKKSARMLVATLGKEITGYALILFRRTTSVARLYSVAVSPAARGKGIAKALIAASEEEARKRGEIFMRLEVRADNKAARALYEGLGYRQFGRYLDYYDDHRDALRYEKPLVANPPRTRRSGRASSEAMS
jgi:ribosomal-protein-alanine acetyltransferase